MNYATRVLELLKIPAWEGAVETTLQVRFLNKPLGVAMAIAPPVREIVRPFIRRGAAKGMETLPPSYRAGISITKLAPAGTLSSTWI